jgi:hypothetical protein
MTRRFGIYHYVPGDGKQYIAMSTGHSLFVFGLRNDH